MLIEGIKFIYYHYIVYTVHINIFCTYYVNSVILLFFFNCHAFAAVL